MLRPMVVNDDYLDIKQVYHKVLGVQLAFADRFGPQEAFFVQQRLHLEETP